MAVVQGLRGVFGLSVGVLPYTYHFMHNVASLQSVDVSKIAK